ncbi:molybdopterin-dependent oxidoreductase [Kitasatospora sp. NPDC092948]|uniref:molybdopterin-dependent oxidoreductase n=1 Tax=Kitasatospora sp. NPDC092948 TaxID=3364088 RepID=UPI0038133E76
MNGQAGQRPQDADRPSGPVRTVCGYCGVGCGLLLDLATAPDGTRTVRRTTGDPQHPANRGRLCTKGATTGDLLAAPGRLTTALVRPSRGGPPIPVPAAEAIADTARRLRAVLDEHGPDAIAFYVSGQLGLEAQYLANKLAKGFVRTNRIESNSRLCMAGAATGYKLSLGADGPPGSYDDLDLADVFLAIGSNAADCHPVLFLRMMDRVKAGAKLIVVDPRRTATAAKADLFLQIAPGTDLALLNGLLHLLHRAGRTDPEFISRHTEGWEAMLPLLDEYPPDRVARITGLAEPDLHRAAELIGEAREFTSLWTMGLNQSTHGTWNTNALVNLHLATGAVCRPGSGPLSLTGQPNAMGGREMGYMGPGLPGQRTVLSSADREFTERLWKLPPGTLRADGVGTGTVDMFRRMADGEIKACWIICTNPVATVGNRRTVIDALSRAELVITQDVFAETETNAYADVVLPAALWTESEGVLVSSERTLTLARPAVAPPGEALPDWRIIAEVAQAMGFSDGFRYESAEQVFDELRRAHNPVTGWDLRGIDYPRLRDTPVQWPAAEPAGPARNPIRYLRPDGTPRFPTPSGRAIFHPRPHLDPAELPDDTYPFVLNTGRLPHQWHTLTKTAKVAKLLRLDPSPFVELHPADAAELGIAEGDRVEVASRRGRAVLPASVTDRVRPGNCFAPFHWNDLFGADLCINAVTSDATDPLSQQLELKYCAVALTRVEAAAETSRADRTADGGAPPQALVLWASQTGTAEEFAAAVAAHLAAEGRTAELRALADTDPAELPPDTDLLFVTSTYGDGDAPDNGAAFWDALSADTAARLDGRRFAVLAFGDPHYPDFCGHGRRLDARLAELGARRLAARVDCAPDDDTAVPAWLDAVFRRTAAGQGRTPAGQGRTPAASVPARRRDFAAARLVGNRLLSGPGSGKEVRRFTFDLGEPLDYSVGDALTVQPVNSPELVGEWLSFVGDSSAVTLPGRGPIPFREALTAHLDITRVGPALLRFCADRTGRGRALLADPDALSRWSRGRQAIDVAREFGVRASAREWAEAFGRLTPRQYSICSSPLTDPRLVSLTVSVVRWASVDGRRRGGVCSTHLADAEPGVTVPVRLRRAPHFRPPADPATPAVMIGPGTGVAPFLGFLDDRRARGHTAPNWLFFGAQHRATDFYYREELTAHLADGTLTRLDTAFSRDQPAKTYVQHRLREQGRRLWSWLQDGAHLYVCGDATRMAAAVDRALHEIVAAHGGLTPEEAAVHVKQLAADKRYVRDVY